MSRSFGESTKRSSGFNRGSEGGEESQFATIGVFLYLDLITPLPPTPSGVVRFRMHFEPGPDLHVYSSLQMAYTGAGASTPGLVTLAGDVRTQFSAHLASLLYSGDALFDVEAYDLQFPATPLGQDSTVVVGTRAGTQVPNNCTAGIFFEPNRRYRGSKPKIFLPFGVQGDLASPTIWTAPFVTALGSGWNAFIAGLTGAAATGYTLGNQVAVSYFSGSTSLTTGSPPHQRGRTIPTPRATPLVQGIVSVNPVNVLYSQRRRLRP